MPKLDTVNTQYAKHMGQWKRCRDMIEGQDAIYAAGERYLPRLKGQTIEEYTVYMHRATVFGASGRTLEALSGMVFSTAPRITVPAAMQDWLKDIALDGTSIYNLANHVVEELLAVGRLGLIVEHPDSATDAITIGQAEALNLRPYIRTYNAESIVDWRLGTVNGATDYTMIRLMESVEVPGANEFESSTVEQCRVLDLFEGRYRVRLYRRDPNKKDEWVQLGEDSFPLSRNQPIPYIPFCIINAGEVCADVSKPPMLDLVNQNIAHYRNTADFEHGLHFTGLPTPVVSGVQLEPNQSLSIGSTTAWVFPDPQAKAEFLEFTGVGLKSLSDELKAKEHRMAVLGARMLEESKRSAESTETTMIKYAGEHATLGSIAKVASEGLEIALRYAAQWAGIGGEITVSLNSEFGAQRLSPQELTALVAAWQSGAISKQTLFENLQTGKIIADGTLFEDEQARLDTSAPEFAQGGDLGDDERAGVLQRIRDRLGV
ncbi:MAG TPA: DUF4055 domain-containing protein [Limnobacter sp.]|nr:DUF4055 domain-containing protein [Limnobacter sp.]